MSAFFRSAIARKLFTLAAVGFTVLIFGYLLYREREVLFNHAWRINGWALLAAFILYSLALFLASYVWVGIVRALGVKVRFWQHFQYYSVSMLAKRLPGTIWYVAYRSQMYEKEGISPKVTTLASGVEFAVVLVSGMVVSLMFAVPILQQYQASIVGIVILFLLGFGFLHPRVLKWLFRKLNISADQFKNRDILSWVFVYILVRLLTGGIIFSIAWFIYPLPLENLSYVIGGYTLVSVLSNALVFLPTNLAFNEVTYSIVLTNILPSSIAVIIAVLSRVFITLFELVWALIALIAGRLMKNPDQNG